VKDNIKPEGSHYDILLIEDDLATIRLLRGYFESEGVTCKGVISGTKGLEELVKNSPKVVILDIILPDYSGYDICKKIKSIQKLKNIPVFLFPSIGFWQEKHLAETKADGYILKPFKFSDFDGILDLLKLHKNKDESTKNSKTPGLTDEEIEKLGFVWKQINQYITLKLENRKTQIYVKDKLFLQCIQLVLNISKKDVPIYDEINSIDEAADLYQKRLYQNEIVEGPAARPLNEYHNVTPEQEFWAHCSNLQAWYENDYDTRLLHSNLAFNLLKALVKAGDPNAKRVFKTEVAERFGSGYPNTIISILNAKLLDYFSLEEKRELIRPHVPIILKHAPELLDCFSSEEKRELIRPHVPIILKHAPELLDCFSSEEKKELIQENKAIIFEKLKSIANKISKQESDIDQLLQKKPLDLGKIRTEIRSLGSLMFFAEFDRLMAKGKTSEAFQYRRDFNNLISIRKESFTKYNIQEREYSSNTPRVSWEGGLEFKVCIVGDDDPGKITLLHRYTDKVSEYADDVAFYIKRLEIDGKTVELSIWDISNEGDILIKSWRRSTHFKGANGGIFAYNVNDDSSLRRIIMEMNFWSYSKHEHFPIMVVGLISEDEKIREVSSKQVYLMTYLRNLDGYVECNVKTGENVEEVFKVLARLMIQNFSLEQKLVIEKKLQEFKDLVMEKELRELGVITLTPKEFKRYAQIYHYLKKNSGKAFTAQALYNRIDDIGLEEEAKSSLDVDALGENLINLYVSGKITRQDKEGKMFYFF